MFVIGVKSANMITNATAACTTAAPMIPAKSGTTKQPLTRNRSIGQTLKKYHRDYMRQYARMVREKDKKIKESRA